jgi:hypothetical protein
MKYVMIERDLGSGMKQLIPVIFPTALVHKDVADAVMRSMRVSEEGVRAYDMKVVSAGECRVRAEATFGSSGTLMLSARAADAMVISQIDYSSVVEEDYMPFCTAEQVTEFGKNRKLVSVAKLDVNGRHTDISGRKFVRARLEFEGGEVVHITQREYDKMMAAEAK